MHMPKFVRLLAAIALVGISAWPGTLVAQKARATSLGVGGGLTMPIGDYSDCCGSGFNVGGFVQWRQPDQVFGLRGEVQYNRNNVKEAWIDTPGVTGHADMLNFGIDGVLEVAPQGSSTGWYLLAGVGMYQSKFSFSGALGSGASDSKTELGFNAGGGLTFQMGGAKLFVEGRWHTVSIDNATYAFIPLTVGLRF
jgi:hypothetical protein